MNPTSTIEGAPARFQICSGSCLKVIAILSMLVDHSAGQLLRDCAWAFEPWLEVGRINICLYFVLRNVIGRIGFPLFAFLVAEGYAHTSDVKRYALRLLFFAILTEPIWDLVHTGCAFTLRGQNVLFTLCLGVVGMWLIDHLDKRWPLRLLAFVGVTLSAFLLRCDYGMVGVVLIMLFHLFRSKPELQYLAIAGVLGRTPYSAASILSIIPIALYNGKRGFIRGAWGKYIFYAIYPLHLLILYVIKYHVM